MLTRLLLTLFVVSVVTTSAVQASAFVLFRLPDRIVIAADSLVIPTSDKKGFYAPPRRVCKIHRSGKWWFSIGGSMGSYIVNGHAIRDEVNFNEMVATAIRPTPNIVEAVAAITAISPKINDNLKASYEHRPDAPVMLEILVAGIDRSQPTVGICLVTLTRRKPFELTLATGVCPGSGCRSGRIYHGASALADGPLLTELRRSPRRAWLSRGDAAAARRLITLESKAAPNTVGTPIDVLELRPDGRALWVGRDKASACLPIRKSA